MYRSFFRRMVQRYVKFGNFRSPVAASFAALQKVRSAPPVTGLLLSAVRRLLFAVCYPPSAARRLPLALCCSLPAARCSPSAVRRPLFAACCPCLSLVACVYCSPSAARYSLPATLCPPPQPAAARVDSSPANPFLSGYALNRPHMCAERRSMLFCLASDVVETEFLFIFVQINKGKQLFIPLADRGTSSGDCLNRVWVLSVPCYALI